MKRLIYTAVFGNYDRVYPPVAVEADVDYVIFTDNADMHVEGWRNISVDMSRFTTPSAANRYYKIQVHHELPGYDASLYVDGNIRILGSTHTLFNALKRSGADMALFQHPLRNTISEELHDVIATGKADARKARDEYNAYLRDGFPDTVPLSENTIMIKLHKSRRMHEAMELWWKLYEKYGSRDQLSFSYVVWKTGMKLHHLPGTFREKNPFFAIYPHIGKGHVNPRYVNALARSHDNAAYFFLIKLWQAKWHLQRKLMK